MPCFVSVKTTNGEYKNYEVPDDVYVYIKQLEKHVKYPDMSKLKELYSDRFSGSKVDPTTCLDEQGKPEESCH